MSFWKGVGLVIVGVLLAALIAALGLAFLRSTPRPAGETAAETAPCWTFPFMKQAHSEIGMPPEFFSDNDRADFIRELNRHKKNCTGGSVPPPGVNANCVKAIIFSEYQQRVTQALPSWVREKERHAARKKHTALYNAAVRAGYSPQYKCGRY